MNRDNESVDYSILLLTYNQAQVVKAALRPLISQVGAKGELVICDDASSDETLEVIDTELAAHYCEKNIRVVRRPRNLGLVKNFSDGALLCKGEIIIVAAGDDISAPDRAQKIIEEFRSDAETMLVFSNWTPISPHGKNATVKLRKKQKFSYNLVSPSRSLHAQAPIIGACAAYRRCLFEIFGPLAECRIIEDQAMWIRGLILGNLSLIEEPLVKYRLRDMTKYAEQDKPYFEKGKNRLLAHSSRSLKRYETCKRQWLADIETAKLKGYLKDEEYLSLVDAANYTFEKSRFSRYCLYRAPLRLWYGSFKRLLPRCRTSHRSRRMFILVKLRLSRSRQTKKLHRTGAILKR